MNIKKEKAWNKMEETSFKAYLHSLWRHGWSTTELTYDNGQPAKESYLGPPKHRVPVLTIKQW